MRQNGRNGPWWGNAVGRHIVAVGRDPRRRQGRIEGTDRLRNLARGWSFIRFACCTGPTIRIRLPQR